VAGNFNFPRLKNYGGCNEKKKSPTKKEAIANDPTKDLRIHGIHYLLIRFIGYYT